jgi:hypothetical protein
MLTLWIAALIACQPGPADDTPPPAVGANVYLESMWSERALTVRAGLEEAEGLYNQGDPEGAAELVLAVYHGSFEPELEPLIREVVDPRKAAELEYRFGLVRDAVERRRNKEGVHKAIATLVEQLDRAAAELDGARAVIEG